MYRPKVRISHDRTFGGVRCEQCDAGFEWTRERARQHAANRGHTVHFLINDITTYTPLESHRG